MMLQKNAKKEDTKDDNVVDADFEEVKDENKEKKTPNKTTVCL